MSNSKCQFSHEEINKAIWDREPLELSNKFVNPSRRDNGRR